MQSSAKGADNKCRVALNSRAMRLAPCPGTSRQRDVVEPRSDRPSAADEMSIYVRPPNARTRERDADKMEQAAKVYDEKTLVDCLHANPLGMVVKDGAATLGPGGMDIYEWYDQNGDMSAKVSAVRAAAMWMNLVTNKLSLPHNSEVADAMETACWAPRKNFRRSSI